MSNAFSQINWLAVLAAAVAHFVLAGLWFGVLFGRQYAVALGIEDRPASKPGPLFLAGPFVCGAVVIATTAALMRGLHVATYRDALSLGAIVGIGYLGAMTLTIAINPLFPRPFRYALVNAPLFLIGSVMSCLILVAMG